MEFQGEIHQPTEEDVILKIKDEGDFDSLRLKIIKKLKENEALRNHIILEVKQSMTLNSDGAENLKANELSDGIHNEIGSKIMGEISKELWDIIKSDEHGMQKEIKETIESVYNKLISRPPKEEYGISTQNDHDHHSNMSKNNSSALVVSKCDSDPDLPPGFSLSDRPPVVICGNGSFEPLKEVSHSEQDIHKSNHVNVLPEFSQCVNEDELDLPPGFG